MLNARSGCNSWLLVLLLASSAAAAEGSDQLQGDKASGRFLRLTRDKDETPVAMETAIVRLARNAGPTVDLVAAVHIADKRYYEQLNRELAGYDAVLYELVAPENSCTPRPGDSTGSHPISLLQNGMKDILGLEFQLKEIDYTRKNMVHADMSPDQFAKSMSKRGESLMTMLARVLGYAMTQENDSSHGAGNGQLLLALFDKNRTSALKRIMAEQFEQSDGFMAALEGPTGSTLISGRNAVALDMLRKEIAEGKRKIAIFYGAAHMPNFQTRLRSEFGLMPVSTRWIVAWNLKP